MPAGKHNFILEKGADFKREIKWTDSSGQAIDLTGYSARMHIRSHRSNPTLLLELTNANGRIALGGAAGTVNLSVTAADTETLDLPAKAVYDLELVSGTGAVTRLLEGDVTITQEVTR